MRILAVISRQAGPAHVQLATEALRRTATVLEHDLAVESDGDRTDPTGADVLVLVGRGAASPGGSAAPAHAVSLGRAIRETREVLTEAVQLARPDLAPPRVALPFHRPPVAPPAPVAGKRLVAITACPTGIAHTFMAAEALQKAARALGHTIRIETQGSVGAKTPLTPEEIAAADAVVIAAETKVDTARFAGKPVFTTSTKHAMRAGQEVVRAALAQPASVTLGAPTAGAATASRPATPQAERGPGPYQHLMTGVSYMLPVVIAGGLAIALAFAAVTGKPAGEWLGEVVLETVAG